MRILIVKRDKLGDLLLARPVISRLAAAVPEAELHLLANDYNAWVARDHPALARTWAFGRVRDGRRLDLVAAVRQVSLHFALRRQRFDWAIVMGGDESHRAIRRALATHATRVIAYAQESTRYGPGLTDPLPPPSSGHETARMLALCAPLGVRGGALDAPSFAIDAGATAFAMRWLTEQGLAARRYVVIGLGARRAKKQPTPSQVAAWSTRILRERGLSTVLMWTPGTAANAAYPGDDALAQAVLDQRLPHVHPFRGPIREALGLICAARTSIIPDSGLMHFAAASEGGVLGLFADPQDSAPASRWAPLGVRARHIEAPKRVADLADDAVFAVLDPLLDSTLGSEL